MNPYLMPQIAGQAMNPFMRQMQQAQQFQAPQMRPPPGMDASRIGMRQHNQAIEENPYASAQPQVPGVGQYDPNQEGKNMLGMKMKRGTADYLSDLGAGIGQAFDNPFVQALSYANQAREARMGGDPEAQQRQFENELRLRQDNRAERESTQTNWQIGEQYDEETGQSRKVLYDPKNPENVKPFGGAKKDKSTFQTTTIYDAKTGQPVTGVFNPSTGKLEGTLGGPKAKDAKPGFSVRTNPDGSTEFFYGEGQGLSSSNQTKVQGDIIGAQDGIARLDQIARGYKPEYQQLGTRLSAAVTAGKEKIGMAVAPEEQAVLQDFTKYKRDATENLNLRIKELTGSAMGVQEAERIISSLPNPGAGLTDGDSPTEFKSKLDSTVRALKEVEARRIYTMQKGIQPADVPLGSMSTIIDKRGDEIETQIRKANPQADPAQIEQTVRDQLKREFGL